MMSHWDLHAKQWSEIGEPLRPSAADIAIFSAWLKGIKTSESQPFNVLLLGTTPELAAIQWPHGTQLFVVDANLAMVKLILLKEKLSVSPFVSIGNWLHMPFPESMMDLVVGDGCLSMLAEENYGQFADEIIRVLRPAGHCFMRFFIRPDLSESIEQIHRDLITGKIDNFHILKWRIAMALHGSLSQGVSLDNVWEVWDKNFKGHTRHLPWSSKTIRTIAGYKNNLSSYTFPTFCELRLKLDKKFRIIDTRIPEYTLGERCPILKFKPL